MHAAGPCDIPGYNYLAGKAPRGTDLLLLRSFTGTPTQLATRCRITPGCVGFTTNGVLKVDMDTAAPVPDMPSPAPANRPCWGAYVSSSSKPYQRWLGLRTDLSKYQAAQNSTTKQYASFIKALDSAKKLKASGGVRMASGAATSAVQVRRRMSTRRSLL